MAEQLPDRADIVLVLQQVGGEGMSKRLARGPFDQASPLNGRDVEKGGIVPVVNGVTL